MVEVTCDDDIGIITLANTSRLNVLSKAFVQDLNTKLDTLENDDAVKVIIVRGSNGFFSAGADIRELATETAASAKASDFVEHWHHLSKCKKIVLIEINGHALGGGLELALQGDLIFIGSSSKISLPEIKISTLPGGAGSVRLLHMIGYQKTMAMCLTGDSVDGPESARMGITYACVADDILHDTVLDFAKKLTSSPLKSLKRIKRTLRFTQMNTAQDSIAFERDLFYETLDDPNTKEGIAAFFEKREPKWS